MHDAKKCYSIEPNDLERNLGEKYPFYTKSRGQNTIGTSDYGCLVSIGRFLTINWLEVSLTYPGETQRDPGFVVRAS